MSQIEPYLPDDEVARVQGLLYDEYPELRDWNTQFLSARIEPPWHGRLPDGHVGWTTNAVLKFVISSDHPRALQRSMGVKQTDEAVVWQLAFENSRKSRSHYVSSSEKDPLETIFRGLLKHHMTVRKRLASIINDAVPDPSKPKSALEAL